MDLSERLERFKKIGLLGCLNNIEKKMEWIKCSDRLPPKASYNDCKKYLIFCGYSSFSYWYNDMWVSDPDEFYLTFDPTHWMTLPNPPI